MQDIIDRLNRILILGRLALLFNNEHAICEFDLLKVAKEEHSCFPKTIFNCNINRD